MTKTKTLAALISCLALGACGGLETVTDIYQQGGEKAIGATGRILDIECARNLERRKSFVDQVNALQAERGKTPRAVAQDCDGDGQPDF